MDEQLKSRIDEILSGSVGSARVPGMVAAVADRGGTRYEGAFGLRELGGEAPMTLDTVGEIMSMTKPMTAVVVMQLVERGELDLDAPAVDVIPWFGETQVLDGFADDGSPLLRAPVRPITLRHLLTHTSGFVYTAWNEHADRYAKVADLPPRSRLVREAYETPLAFDPGFRWEYGIGIDWAGWMAEAVTGRRLGDLFCTELFEPLGMVDTAYVPTASMLERLASAHRRKEDGTLVARPREPMMDRQLDTGGGGLFGTVPDYVRFLRMVLNGGQLDGQRVIGAETLADMMGNHIGDLRVTPLPAIQPAMSNRVDLMPEVPKTWGLSWLLNEETSATGRSPGSVAWAGLLNSYFWVDPTNGIAGVYLSQLLPFVDGPTLEVFSHMEQAVYDTLGP